MRATCGPGENRLPIGHWPRAIRPIVTPVRMPSLSNVTAIASRSLHAVALVGTTVWTWGLNTVRSARNSDRQPEMSTGPVQVPGLNQISGIGTARQATFAFAADNGVWGWGDGVGLGDGTTERRFTPIVLADGGGVWRLATPQFSVPGGNRYTPATVQSRRRRLAQRSATPPTARFPRSPMRQCRSAGCPSTSRRS